jgi:hypothetical protein
MRGVFSRVFSLMIVRLRINENDVRFGSKADIASRPRHVRLDIRQWIEHVCFGRTFRNLRVALW